MKEKKRIYAVVISFNPNIDLLDVEYNSIAPQVERIFYVDNLSTNREEVKEWGKRKEKAVILWMDSNEGIGAAQNRGIRAALREGASHVILFDQDSIVADNFVEELYHAEQLAISEGVKVGITGPVYKSHDDGYFYPIISIENDKYVKIPVESFDNYKTVSHIIASGELIKRSVLEEVGLMREDYFIEFVDFEYCFRAARHNYVTIVAKKAMMNHQMGDKQKVILGRKIGIYSPFRRYFACRNSVLIQRESVFPKIFRKHHLQLSIGKFIISCLYGPQRIKQFKYCIRGFIDGFRGVNGKCRIA